MNRTKKRIDALEQALAVQLGVLYENLAILRGEVENLKSVKTSTQRDIQQLTGKLRKIEQEVRRLETTAKTSVVKRAR